MFYTAKECLELDKYSPGENGRAILIAQVQAEQKKLTRDELMDMEHYNSLEENWKRFEPLMRALEEQRRYERQRCKSVRFCYAQRPKSHIIRQGE